MKKYKNNNKGQKKLIEERFYIFNEVKVYFLEFAF